MAKRVSDEAVIKRIYFIRGRKVMMDMDLAEMYGVETRRLNEQVKRNAKRFPEDFMFRLTPEEVNYWMPQFATSNISDLRMGLRRMPYFFTEQGVAMLSSVLGSDTAIEVNIQIIRVFTRMRGMFQSNKEILLKLGQMEKEMLVQGGRLNKHDREMQAEFEALKHLLQPIRVRTRRIGFRRSSE